MSDIGFIGVGAMGSQMAQRLIAAGHSLTIFDPNQAALVPFEKSARIAKSAAECGGASLIILMVQNDDQLKEALLGEPGVLSTIKPERNSLIAVMSTVLPDTIFAIRDAIKEKGARLIDAPVSGGPVGAREGTLSIMVGGAESDFAEAKPLFEAFGKNIYLCGKLGSGELTKIINNLLGVANTFLFAEALSIGKRYDVDLSRLVPIMDVSSGRCMGTRDWPRHLQIYRDAARTSETIKALTDVCRKDLHHAVEIAHLSGVNVPLAERLFETLNDATYAEIHDRWRSLASS